MLVTIMLCLDEVTSTLKMEAAR